MLRVNEKSFLNENDPIGAFSAVHLWLIVDELNPTTT